MQMLRSWNPRRVQLDPHVVEELAAHEAETQKNEARLRDLVLRVEAEVIARTIMRASE